MKKNPIINIRKKIKRYWDRDDVESMYDKHLLMAEIDLIKKNILPGAKILDAGCGEGEGTLIYASIPNVCIHAVDFSTTRLRMAKQRLHNYTNVKFKKIDFLGKYSLDNNYDIIISQRFLINIPNWRLQQQILLNFMNILKRNGKLILLEGSKEGLKSLNNIRNIYGLPSVPAKWHNIYLSDKKLVTFMKNHGYTLLKEDGLGTYFLLTRGIRPIFNCNLNWDCKFNKKAASNTMRKVLGFTTQFSKLKLWIFTKE